MAAPVYSLDFIASLENCANGEECKETWKLQGLPLIKTQDFSNNWVVRADRKGLFRDKSGQRCHVQTREDLALRYPDAETLSLYPSIICSRNVYSHLWNIPTNYGVLALSPGIIRRRIFADDYLNRFPAKKR